MTLRGAEGVRRVDEEIVREKASRKQFPTPPRHRPDGGIIRDKR